MTVIFCFLCSCLALNDLFRGRSLDDVVNELPIVWETCFRVRDDIKVCDINSSCINFLLNWLLYI